MKKKKKIGKPNTKRTEENHPLTRCAHPGPDADEDGDTGVRFKSSADIPLLSVE